MRALQRPFAVFVLLVTALSACHRPNEYQPTSDDNPSGFDPAQVLVVTPNPVSIPADGLSRTTIEAKIAPEATVRHITFQTSLGTLLSGGTTIAQGAKVVLEADGTGTARVDLVSATAAATARVTVSVGPQDDTKPRVIVRVIDVPFTAPVGGSPIITLQSVSSTAPADGVTTTRLFATISPSLTGTQRTVTFTTTAGDFTSGITAGNTKMATVVADNSNVAFIDLRSPTSVSTADVTASVFNNNAFTSVAFRRADPTTVFIKVSGPSVVVMGTGSVTLDVMLFRDVGAPTDNAVVTYEARDSAGTVIGTFSGVTLGMLDSKGRLLSTAVFDPVDTAMLGTATITVRCGSGSGTIQIELK